jgi:hypothetical protein
MEKLNVGILIFKAAEVLDFAGPFEVFSRTRLVPGAESRRSEDSAPFSVFLVAETSEVIRATADFRVLPHFSFETAPRMECSRPQVYPPESRWPLPSCSIFLTAR